MSEKQWIIEDPMPTTHPAEHPEIHPVVLQLLWNRGVREASVMESFLRPDYDRDVHHPRLFLNMATAVERVFSALDAHERIVIHGDYDADGICGATVLFVTLREIMRLRGEDPTERLEVFLPDRERDGYGFSVPTIERFAEKKISLVITVDCGISNKETIDRGHELGIDTIICDHHAMPETLPDAILIHPQVPNETYPNKHLCGTGVASKLCWGLFEHAREQGLNLPVGHEKWLLDLVAIATVTDVMPLTGENRALETFGLKVLNKTRRPGLKKLIEISGCRNEIETWNIGFQIGPRINASGRIAHASGSFQLLAEEDDLSAAVQAVTLDGQNRQRQQASDALFVEARAQAEAMDTSGLIVTWGEGWHLGLVGLVAGKLVTAFQRPVFVVAKHGDRFTGSGRSIPGIDITGALRSASKHLHRFGGHPQACGFTAIGEEAFHLAMAEARAFIEAEMSGGAGFAGGKGDRPLTLPVDVEIVLDDITPAFVESVVGLAPFGEGNRQPVFVSKRVQVLSLSSIGKDNKHLRMGLADRGGDQQQQGIGFGFGHLLEELSIGDTIDVAYEVGWNEWNGRKSVQLRLVDIQCQKV